MRKHSSYLPVVLVALLLLVSSARAEVKLASVFSDHMVLQRGQSVPVWGWAAPGESVKVTLADQTRTANPDKSGKWIVRFDPMKAGGPVTMTVAGGNKNIVIKDVLIGEVWICSGQSNMEWPVVVTKNSDHEMAQARYPMIRLLKVPHNSRPTLQENVRTSWKICNPDTVQSFSAVGYFFGRSLHKNMSVPVGLIQTAWGGTPAESWTPRHEMEQIPSMAARLKSFDAYKAEWPKGNAQRDRLLAEYNNARKELLRLEERLNGSENLVEKLPSDSSWKKMKVPNLWERAGLKGFDGMVWFRKEINIPAHLAGRNLTLHLGPIDEIDICWFNGKKIDGKGSLADLDVSFWRSPRHYKVPGGLVKAGKNTIIIAVFDQYGGGGLNGGSPNDMFVEIEGGSPSDRIALAGTWDYAVGAKLPIRPNLDMSPYMTTVLYNGMVHPLIPYAIKGVIWYQGESNAGRAYQYRELMPALIRGWRKQWGQGDFVFLQTQLANFMARAAAPQQSGWAELREAQLMATQKLPNVGMAVTIDIGEAKDIHPRNKQDVGKRLALAARKLAYGQDIVYSGPLYESMKIAGKEIRLKFKHVGGGLVARGGKVLKGFAVAGADKKFVWANARIEGDTVVVSADTVAEPVAVRYAWANNPECNLYNREGLPASPFRTDDWKCVTYGKN